MEFRSGSIYIRQASGMLDTGHIVNGHKHNFDHTTFLMAGLWRIEAFGEIFIDGRPQTKRVKRSRENGQLLPDDHPGPCVEIDEPILVKLREVTIRGGVPHAWCLIEANIHHKLTLLEGPGCYACVYSHRVPDGDVTKEFTGWTNAYQ